jgi:hypothetical protein
MSGVGRNDESESRDASMSEQTVSYRPPTTARDVLLWITRWEQVFDGPLRRTHEEAEADLTLRGQNIRSK